MIVDHGRLSGAPRSEHSYREVDRQEHFSASDGLHALMAASSSVALKHLGSHSQFDCPSSPTISAGRMSASIWFSLSHQRNLAGGLIEPPRAEAQHGTSLCLASLVTVIWWPLVAPGSPGGSSEKSDGCRSKAQTKQSNPQSWLSYPCQKMDTKVAKGLGAPTTHSRRVFVIFLSQPMGSTFTLHGVRAGVNRNLVCTLYHDDSWCCSQLATSMSHNDHPLPTQRRYGKWLVSRWSTCQALSSIVVFHCCVGLPEANHCEIGNMQRN